jgi:hypothetical protein
MSEVKDKQHQGLDPRLKEMLEHELSDPDALVYCATCSHPVARQSDATSINGAMRITSPTPTASAFTSVASPTPSAATCRDAPPPRTPGSRVLLAPGHLRRVPLSPGLVFRARPGLLLRPDPRSHSRRLNAAADAGFSPCCRRGAVIASRAYGQAHRHHHRDQQGLPALQCSPLHAVLGQRTGRPARAHVLRDRRIEAEVGEDGLAFDYNLFKDALKALCDRLDEKTLLPERSPYLRIEQRPDYVVARFADEEIPFLPATC